MGEVKAEACYWEDIAALALWFSRGWVGDSSTNDSEILRLDCLRGLGFGVALARF